MGYDMQMQLNYYEQQKYKWKGNKMTYLLTLGLGPEEVRFLLENNI
jgi:hypothetical protein